MHTKRVVSLNKIEPDKNNIKLYFRSYLKTDFVEKALIVTLDNNHSVKELYFSSNDYGTASWFPGTGFANCHRWEDEMDLSTMSTLTRRYPTLLQNGEVPVDYARDLIAPDVLDSMENKDVSIQIKSIILNSPISEDFNWNLVIESMI